MKDESEHPEDEDNENTEEGICESTSATPFNGGWGYNHTTEKGCKVE